MARRRRARHAPPAPPAPPEPVDPLAWIAPWLAVAVGLAALVVYLATLQRGVPGGDSGELIAAAATGGVGHPPGYPLYLLLARAFAQVPLGSVAARVNALSAVCDAAAAGLLAFAVARWSRSAGAGLLAGGLFAFSSRVWSYATVAEVFALNNLLTAALLATLVLAGAHPSPRHVGVAAALLGLAAANHHTSIFVSVPIAAWLALAAARAGAPPRALLATVAGGALLGALPYAYLPIAALGHVAVSWGDTATLAGFWRHVTRAEYGTFRLASDHVGAATSGLEHALAYARDLLPQTLWLGAPLALAGAGAGLADRGRRGAVIACLVGLAGYVIVFNALSNLPLGVPLLFEIQARFWQMPTLIVLALAGLGAGAVSTRISRRRAGALVTAGIAAAAVALQAWLNFTAMDESRLRWIDGYGRALLASAPDGALILVRGDLATNTMRYLRYAEGVRPDVRIVDQEMLSLPWGPSHYARLFADVRVPAAVYDPRRPDGFSLKQLIDANVARLPILVCGGFKPGDDSVTPATYRLRPRGFCAEVERPGAPPPAVDAWLADNRARLPDAGALARAPLRAGSWEEMVRAEAWRAWHAPAQFVLLCADCGLPPAERFTRFVAMADEIVALGPDPPAYVYKDLAYALSQLFPSRPETRDRLVRALQEYVRRGPRDDPDLPAIRDNLVKLGARVPD